MKKKQLTTLSLHKKTISQLTATRVQGGFGPPFAEEGTNDTACQGNVMITISPISGC